MKIILIIVQVLSVYLVSAQNPGSTVLKSQCNPKTLPVLWQQTAAEFRALCYQAFNLATLRINEIPAIDLKQKNLAIITDLDETILDNSYGEAQSILDHQSHSSSTWKEWVNVHSAPALPGAVEFLQYVHSKGISVFYISNRDTGEVSWTLENLKQLALPDADSSHMLFMSTTSSKEQRRQLVMEKYHVVMLLGDNLNDFASCFEKKPIPERISETDRMKDNWGGRFIVFPNSTYGAWEHALYNYRHNLSPEEKDSIRISLLKGYKTK